MSTIDVKVAFAPAAPPSVADDALRLHLPTDAGRAVALRLRPHRPGVVRDALLAIGDVLASDLRHKARDRADYLAYLLAKGKGVSKQVWDAQKEYLALKYSEAARSEEPLDPVVTVGPDATTRIEVMSRDESTYAQLVLRRDGLAEASGSAGTSYVDFTAGLLSAIGRIRTYRPTTIALEPGDAPVARERRVPLRWLRAFGQMQAASLLPATRFELAPVDLYNVLLTLRMRKAKKPPRALRYELVPGSAPRLVIEPWDVVLAGTGGPFSGDRPQVIRTWGRNRLAVLSRVLPHARSVQVSLAGPGLPAFYVVDLGDAALTIAMSGWTDSGWAGVATFDLLAAGDSGALGGRIRAELERGARSLDELATATGESRSAVRGAVLAELGQLRLGHDPSAGVVFARSLLARDLPDDALRFRDAREEQAHRLLAEPGQVELIKVHDLGADGTSIEGQVSDKGAHRSFHPSFTLDREGRTSAASCTCAAFRRAGIKEGPCEHMIAVRVLYARELARLEAARGTAEGRALIRAETRTLLRRDARGAQTYRLSLDGRQLVARYGTAEPLRMQRIMFATADEARAAYFARLEELGAKGYLDGGAGD